MSKLAHSNQETMDEIELRHHVEEQHGRNADWRDYHFCSQCGELLHKEDTPDGCRDPECPVAK